MSNLAYIDDTKEWTYEDVQKLDDENRYEVINGKLYMLASPSTVHQRLSVEISGQIRNYLEGKTCEVFAAPMNVFLDEKMQKSNKAVQPDIFIVCDKNKKGKNHIIGVPDLIIEILSPTNMFHDKDTKLDLYLETGVKEYWIVDPIYRRITKYVLKEEAYLMTRYRITEKVKSYLFPGLAIDISEIYEENEYLLKEEKAQYGISDEKWSYASNSKYINYELGEFEEKVLKYILSLKEDWDYEPDVMKLGAFRKLFELFDGNLVYRGYNVIHFS